LSTVVRPKPRRRSWPCLARSITGRRGSSGARSRCWMRPSRMFRSAALPLTDHSSRDSTGRLALEALKAFMSLTEAPARVRARNRNLRILPTTCARPTAALLSRRPHRAPNIYSALRDFPPPKPCITRQFACGSYARRLLTAGSVNEGRTVVRPLKTERSAGDADDNRAALYTPPTERFTELRMSVSLPIFIQLRKYSGRRRTSYMPKREVPEPTQPCRLRSRLRT
jgi:hypothetical protein